MTKRLTTSDFISKLPDGYTDRYDYTEALYVNSHTAITVRCVKHDLRFATNPSNHAAGKGGCPACKREGVSLRNIGNKHAAFQRGISKKGVDHYVAAFAEAHGSAYTYNWGSFTTATAKMQIECKFHGWFSQTPTTHRKGCGCPVCSRNKQKLGVETVFSRLSTEHPELTFVDVPDVRHADVQFLCKAHGLQVGRVHDMLAGHGCKECGWDKSITAARAAQNGVVSRQVLFLQKFIEAHGFTTELEYSPDWLGRRSLDLYVPEVKFAIEFNGAWCHHSSPDSTSPAAKYARERSMHARKWKDCKDNDVSLLNVWDFKFDKYRHIYLSKILHRLGLDTVVYARKCSVVELDRKDAASVYEDLSLEGSVVLPRASKHYALTYGGKALMFMSVGEKVRETQRRDEVLRMVTTPGVTVVGGVSKLLARCKSGTVMFTTNDTGSVFPGGTQAGSRYWWYHPTTRRAISRAAASPTTREKLNGTPHATGESERAFMERHGWVRVWDSGLTKHVVQ